MELVDLQEEVGRLRRALGEERALRRADVTALWSAIEDLQWEVRRRAVREPVDPKAAVDRPGVPQGPSTAASVTSEDTEIASLCSCGALVQTTRISTPSTCDSAVQTARSSTVSFCDATVQTAGTTSPSCDSAAEIGESVTPSSPEEAVKADRDSRLTSSMGICMLEKNHLKHVLQNLDCAQLLLARQVCKQWRTVINDIIEDCLKTNGDNFREDSVPTSDIHVYLIARVNPRMTKLKASRQRRLDLSAVAISCENLIFADLRGFTITEESLSILLRRNKQLEEMTLPAGCSQDQLLVLSGASALRRITLEAPSGDMWPFLPKKLPELGITGLEVPLDLPQVCLPSLRELSLRDCRELNYTTLASLSTLASGMTRLSIAECPDVTAGGLQLFLARFPKLKRLSIIGCAGVTAELLGKLTELQYLTLYNMPAGVITDTMLDSLHSCSQLSSLVLGDPHHPPVKAITAAAVSRLAVACRKLADLYLHTTAVNSQAVLDALLQVDLGFVRYPYLRYICLRVPDSVFSQLRKPPSCSCISLYTWQ